MVVGQNTTAGSQSPEQTLTNERSGTITVNTLLQSIMGYHVALINVVIDPLT